MKNSNATSAKNDSSVFVGTPAQLAGRIALTFNGQTRVLEQPDISFLTRFGLAKEVGTEKKKTEGRGGKPAKIWEFDAKKISFQLEAVQAKRGRPAKAAAAPAEAPAPTKTTRTRRSAGNSNASLASAIASAVVNVLDAQKAA